MLVGNFRETAVLELISYHDGSVLKFIFVWESTPGCVIAGVISLLYLKKELPKQRLIQKIKKQNHTIM